jgi:hypothetical protein
MDGVKPNPVPTESDSNPNRNSYSDEDVIYDPLEIDLSSLDRSTDTFLVESSPNPPEEVLKTLDDLAMLLLQKRFTLRTSTNDRSKFDGHLYPTYTFKEIFLPWKKFNELVTPTLAKPKEAAYRIALWTELQTKKNYDAGRFNALNRVVKLFISLRMHLLLGKDLNQPVKAIIIYTPCGSTRFTRETDYRNGGRAIDYLGLANFFGIKVYNLGNKESVEELKLMLT